MSVVGELLDELWSVDGSAEALRFEGSVWSWSDLTAAADRVEAVLTESGVPAGHAVGAALENRPQFVAVVLAVLRSGRCLTTVSPMQPAERLAHDLATSEIGTLIASPELWDRLPGSSRPARCITADDQLTFVALPADWDGSPVDRPGVAIEMLTSGTTGAPKRVELRYDQLDSALRSAKHYTGRSDEDRTRLSTGVSIVMLPLTHISGLWGTVQALVEKRRIALLRKFTVDGWVAAVRENRPKTAGLVPPAARMVYEADVDREALSSLRVITSGTAALDPDLADGFYRRYGIPILPLYGATEFTGSVAGWTLRDHGEWWDRKRGSVGRAQPGVELRVVDETGAQVEPGITGRLEVRTAQAGAGAAAWTATTDLAHLDEDGFLFIDGRADAAILRGGFKVHPARVVEVLLRHPGVREAAVVGRADNRLGEVPVAGIEVAPDVAAPSVDELDRHCRTLLTPYEVPVDYVVVEQLPRTSALKVNKVDLLELFDQGS